MFSGVIAGLEKNGRDSSSGHHEYNLNRTAQTPAVRFLFPHRKPCRYHPSPATCDSSLSESVRDCITPLADSRLNCPRSGFKFRFGKFTLTLAGFKLELGEEDFLMRPDR